MFTLQNQPSSAQIIFTGGDYPSDPFGKLLEGFLYGFGYSYGNVWYGLNNWTKSYVSNGVIIEPTDGLSHTLNNVNITDTYDKTNTNIYFNGIPVKLEYVSSSRNTRISTTTGNFLGNRATNQTDAAKYTGSLKYFIWAPDSLSLSDINIIHKVATNIIS